MLRFIAFVAVTTCLANPVVVAGEPAQVLIVAADRPTAAVIPPLTKNARLGVLNQDENEPFDAINARALSMRYATHFIHASDLGSTLSAIFRERFVNQGAVAIDLRAISKTIRFDGVPFDRPVAVSFANFLNNTET
jgi:hypothetical protein